MQSSPKTGLSQDRTWYCCLSCWIIAFNFYSEVRPLFLLRLGPVYGRINASAYFLRLADVVAERINGPWEHRAPCRGACYTIAGPR
jgi:hypothetical protein